MASSQILMCCNLELFDGYSFTSHLRDHHVDRNHFFNNLKEQITVPCPFCNDVTYKTFSGLKQHMESYHRTFMNSSSRLNFSSDYSQLVDPQSNDLNDIEFDEEEFNYDQIIKEVNEIEIPHPIEASSSIESINESQKFSILLQNELIANSSNQKTINSVATKVLTHVKEVSKDLCPEFNNKLDELIKIAKSEHIQRSKTDQVLNFKDWVKCREENGSKLYYVDLRKQLIHVLKKREVMAELMKDRLSKLHFLIN